MEPQANKAVPQPATATGGKKSPGVRRIEQAENPRPVRRRSKSSPSSIGSPPTTETAYGKPPAEAAGSDREAAVELLAELGAEDGELGQDGTTRAAPTPPAELRALLEAVWVAWNLCAEVRPSWERWILTDRECRTLTEAWLPVAIKYEAALALGPELAAAVVTVAVLAPRFQRLQHADPSEPSATPGYVIQ